MELYEIQNPWASTHLGGEAGLVPIAGVRLADGFFDYSATAPASRSFTLNTLAFRDGDVAFHKNAHGAMLSTQHRLQPTTNVQLPHIKQESFSDLVCESPLTTAVDQTVASHSMSRNGHAVPDLDASLSSSSSLLTSSATSSSTTASTSETQQHSSPGVTQASNVGSELHIQSRSAQLSSSSPSSQPRRTSYQRQQQLQIALQIASTLGDVCLPFSSQAVSKGVVSTGMVSLAASAGPSGSGHHTSHHGGHHGPHGSGHHSATLAGNNQRIQRNIAEKQRRDKLNSSISELATMVPMVGMSSKRLDKTSILRLSAGHLRFHQTQLVSRLDFPGVIQDNQSAGPIRRRRRWRPAYVNHNHLRELIDALEGFVLVTNMHGKIIYVSPTVEGFLGHQHIEMIGHSLFTFMHAADVNNVHMKLQSLFLAKEQYRLIGDQLVCDDVSFFCRIREKTQPRSEVITYQAIYAIGRIAGPARFEENSGMGSAHSTALAHNFSPARFLLKTFVRILNASPYKELSLTDANRDEYVTRHKLDGTIIYADHRIGVVTGHLPHEVIGVSAHKYMDPSDVVIALFAQKQMLASHSGKGVVVYRLRTRGDDYIYLRTSGYLHYDQTTMQVDHFVCVNTLMSKEEGERERQELCNRFSPHINSVTVEHLNDFFSSVHAHTLRRIQRSKESTEINLNKHVPGGSACDPLALENLVEPNLLLGSNCFVKLKTEYDSEDLEEISVGRMSCVPDGERASCASGDTSHPACSTMDSSAQSLIRNAESSSLVSRSNDGVEVSNLPVMPSTSPVASDARIGIGVEVTQFTQGQFSSNVNVRQLMHSRQSNQQHLQQLQSRKAKWNSCNFQRSVLTAVGTHHRNSSGSSIGYAPSGSPSSICSSPVDDAVHRNM
ncbi:uncharacterized protein LOC111255285 isoform X3 [Varroa destructor]|uniref:Methoprene-tolerant protein n=1 Tax=Varroa destructor TaxID=109461 RepID=A0A7M7MFH3_VARDE|nr:uncharacterized protein LOC111255285 isoform X3 [Varroa destructor]